MSEFKVEFFATLEVPVDFFANAAGDGLWGMDKDYLVHFTSIMVLVADYGDCHSIEVRFIHDKVPYNDGLCYTDNGIRDKCRTAIMEYLPFFFIDPDSVDGSEQGMQDYKFFSCDAVEKEGIPFTRSYFKALNFEFED